MEQKKHNDFLSSRTILLLKQKSEKHIL